MTEPKQPPTEAALRALSDEQLAAVFADEVGVSAATAKRAVGSNDPDLGREYVIALLLARGSHREGQQRLTHQRRNLRSSA
jgi:hypothetical protein